MLRQSSLNPWQGTTEVHMRRLAPILLALASCGTDATPAGSDLRMIAFPAGCTNQVQDDDETDVDCGGSCPACDTAQVCKGAKDCRSGLCVNRACAAPSCTDMVQNGGESDLDCGAS